MKNCEPQIINHDKHKYCTARKSNPYLFVGCNNNNFFLAVSMILYSSRILSGTRDYSIAIFLRFHLRPVQQITRFYIGNKTIHERRTERFFVSSDFLSSRKSIRNFSPHNESSLVSRQKKCCTLRVGVECQQQPKIYLSQDDIYLVMR